MGEFDFNALSQGCSLAAPGLALVFLRKHWLKCLDCNLLRNMSVTYILIYFIFVVLLVGRFKPSPHPSLA